MLPRHELSEHVRRVDPLALLPADRELGAPTRPLQVLAVAELSASIALVVVRGADDAVVAAPIRADGPVRRAVPGEGAARLLARVLAQRGQVDGFDVVAVDPGKAPASDAAERPMLVDQTHESVVVGDAVVVKWAVRAEQTPAPTLVRHLSEAGFDEMPRPWGFVTCKVGDGESLLVASAVEFLPLAFDGWTWAVEDAATYIARDGELRAASEPMGEVGRLVADLHSACATATSVIAEPVCQASAQDVDDWHRLAAQLLRAAHAAVDGPEGARLADRRDRMAAAIDEIRLVGGTPTVPVHGDLHVGQVLRWSGGYAVGDFDGNPVLPVAERLRPQPAVRDVAGMLQAIDHVGRVVDRRVDGASPDRVPQWIGAAQQSFLDGYLDRLRGNGHAALFDERLLLPFQVEQECREFLYAVHHLPRWRYVPDQALQALFP